MSNVEIREILSSETARYKKFLTSALQHDKESLLITEKDNENSTFPTKDKNDSFTLGAYIDNMLAGIVSFDRDGENREKLRHKGIISTMYVSKEFRGLGIAKDLLKELIKRVKAIADIEQIKIVVITTNSKAKQLYENFGFEKYGTELNSIKWQGKYFSEDLMVLRLKSPDVEGSHKS